MNEDYQKELLDKKIKMTKDAYNKCRTIDINIYQVVTVILVIISLISILTLSAQVLNNVTLAIGLIIGTLVVGLFIYGFGEIIKQLKIINMQLSILNYQNNNNK